jgi:undecaprenyl diphosphate synthase
MDGNGRWAHARLLPRTAGHAKGVQSVRRAVETCGAAGVKYLTLFAFSSENWRRPAEEVSLLMRLFVQALEREVARLQEQGVRLHVVGDLSAFEPKLQELIAQAQEKTAHNDKLHLTIAANYGGRWDIAQAAAKLVAQNRPINEAELATCMALAHVPDPDLIIRTGGEHRLSNFLLWQAAYSELLFTEKLWPEFDEAELALAIQSYGQRQRRFGLTPEQLSKKRPSDPK